MPFYTFNQNNSGGRFVENADLAQFVIIEAKTLRKAAKKAKKLGVYFDGCQKGRDCLCCGDRWYMPWDDDGGTEVPEIYGNPAEDYVSRWSDTPVRVHYRGK